MVLSMYRWNAILFLLLIILMSAGCGSSLNMAPSKQMSDTEYSDERISPTSYNISVATNSSRRGLKEDLLLRAAEITLGSGYNVFVADSIKVEMYDASGNRIEDKKSAPSSRVAKTSITMYHTDQVPYKVNLSLVFNAQEILERLGQRKSRYFLVSS